MKDRIGMDSCYKQQEQDEKPGKGQQKKPTATASKEEASLYPFAVDEGIDGQKPGEGCQSAGNSGGRPTISTRSAERGGYHHEEAVGLW